MSRLSKPYRVTLSEYQRSKLLSITGKRDLKSAVISFVRSGTRLPATIDRTVREYPRFRLPNDVVSILMSNGDSVSAGMRNLMGVSKSESSDAVHHVVALTPSQYDTLKLLGGDDVSEGLKLLLGA
ncbi:hypothetical protein VchM-138_0020 [Vibrio phage vB_VchM-138]|uniref:hypothetical protein n=1 Tax=Vibrio phage vB_VchM-138 TaxID=1127518 RepID=UPI0002536E04|nr:hypothetical protein F397_gp20 [Vibrio phage vB_VchM-138]AFC22699.1 hypothetical protein VchM-138_0020 [Vibrio phage vB_VchM-138]